METLLVSSFPEEEYRQLEELREYTDRTGNFHNNIVFDGDLPIGFLTYWKFESFCYVEHFATNPALRNGGYGSRAMAYLCDWLGCPVVLEVERPSGPDDEMPRRRVGFYQRLGFKLWRNDYRQPPYRQGGTSLPMYLMVHGNLDPGRDYAMVKRQIYTAVYGVNSP
jgi:GNAT superfamily N-acetyltransferase